MQYMQYVAGRKIQINNIPTNISHLHIGIHDVAISGVPDCVCAFPYTIPPQKRDKYGKLL